MANSKKTNRWLQRKKRIRNSATLTGRQLTDDFAHEMHEAGYELDHITPLNLGGRHHRGNAQGLTKSHNRDKSDKPWFTWYHPDGITCVPYPLDPDEYATWLANHPDA